MKNTDAAFPYVVDGCELAQGLSKREYFAGLAMQGILASHANPGALGYALKNHMDIPVEAVKHADALLAELEKSS